MLVHDERTFKLYQGSCLEVLKSLPDESVDAIATDPPYGFDPLDENGNERPLEESDWDQGDARRDLGPADTSASLEEQYQQRRANSVCYQSGMSDDRHDATTWGVSPVVGGYAQEKGLIALPRYVMPPKALFNYQLWSGMWAAECLRVLKPGGHLLAFNGTKTYHRMATGIEDAGFDIRDTIHWTHGKGHPTGTRPWHALDRAAGYKTRPKDAEWEAAKKQLDTRYMSDVPQSPDAQKWAGWHTGLKPSHEIVCVARKPFKGPIHKNLLKHGTGAYNVEDCAVPVPGLEADRWPANTILTHSPDCGEFCAPYCPVALLEAQHPGASRYFTVTRWEEGEFPEHLRYVSKPTSRERHGTLSGSERNPHPTVKPTAVMAWLIQLVTPPGGIVLDPFAGSGTTGRAAIQYGFFPWLIERDPKFIPVVRQRCAHVQLPLLPPS